jgi:hypothetical protein
MCYKWFNKWNCQLSVPEGCLSAYQAADQWKDFFFVDENALEEDTVKKSRCEQRRCG